MPAIQPFEKPNGWKTQPVPTQAMPRVRRRWNQVHRKERIAHLTSRNPTGVGVSCRFQWPPGWHGIIFFVGDPCNILSPPSFPTVFLGRGENTVPGSLYIWLELLVNVRIYMPYILILFATQGGLPETNPMNVGCTQITRGNDKNPTLVSGI